MTRPSSFSTFNDLSAPEIAAMQSGAPRQEPRDEAIPLARTSAPQPQWALQAQPQWTSQGRPRWIYQAQPSRTLRAQQQQPYYRQQAQQGSMQPYPPQPTTLYPRQRPPSQRPPVHVQVDWQQEIARPFLVKEAYIHAVFESLMKKPEFQLPEPREPDQVSRDINPYYCPYHRVWGHELEDCADFNEWLERSFAEGLVVLPAIYLVDPPVGSTRFVVSPPDSPTSSSGYSIDPPASSGYSIDPPSSPMNGWIQ